MKNLSITADSKDSLLQAFKPRNYKKLSNEALSKLKESFTKNRYPNKESLEKLAQELQETFPRIESWFRSQRKKQFQKGSLWSMVIFFNFCANSEKIFLIRKDIIFQRVKLSSSEKNLKNVIIKLQNSWKICTTYSK